MLIALAVTGLRRPGMLAGIFAIGYAAARIFCEFFREPDPQLGFLMGDWLTMGMLLSLPLALAGMAVIIAARRGLTGPGAPPPREAPSP